MKKNLSCILHECKKMDVFCQFLVQSNILSTINVPNEDPFLKAIVIIKKIASLTKENEFVTSITLIKQALGGVVRSA